MAKKLYGNAIIAQSGGPTAVINASCCGAIQTLLKSKRIGTCFAGLNGVLGVLQEELFDLRREDPGQIQLMRTSPSAALGSCRHKLKSLDESRADYQRLLEVFKAHDIRYFFYNGGNDSMDTADKLSQLAELIDYELIVMGIPKTIDNDLGFTDHTPGYGSVAKYNATVAMEAGRDNLSLYTNEPCTVMETMGRNAGWIAAATGVAARTKDEAPHLIYLPEVAFTFKQFESDVKAALKKHKRCFIVVGEGLKDKKGNYVTMQAGTFGKDSFGHAQLGGVAESLKSYIEEKIKVKCRYIKMGTAQRNGSHFASGTDAKESYLCGRMAARHALAGTSGKMVTLERARTKTYKCTTGLVDLSKVANAEKPVPRKFINKAGNHITKAMVDYVAPLMVGQVKITIGDDGLPVFTRFDRKLVKKRCKVYKVK